jgi:hypothetical protein
MKRQAIIDFLDANLKQISVSNGFNTDAGKNVFDWRSYPITSAEIPAIVYNDNLAKIEKEGPIGFFRWVLRVQIAFYGNSAKEVRNGIADILKVIKICDSSKFGGQAVDVSLAVDSSEMVIERHNTESGASLVAVEIIYDAPLWET